MVLCLHFYSLKLAIGFFSNAKGNSFISVEKPHNERNNKRDRNGTNISISMRPKINSQLERSKFNIITFFRKGGQDRMWSGDLGDRLSERKSLFFLFPKERISLSL